jgi:hypothetical protein
MTEPGSYCTTCDKPNPSDKHLRKHERRAVQDAALAAAWRQGYYTGKRDYAGSIMGGQPLSTPNPYIEQEVEHD